MQVILNNKVIDLEARHIAIAMLNKDVNGFVAYSSVNIDFLVLEVVDNCYKLASTYFNNKFTVRKYAIKRIEMVLEDFSNKYPTIKLI